jgi:hypothetical protein
MILQAPLVVWFEKLGRGDVALVGGKNASLGEMVRHLGERGVQVSRATSASWIGADEDKALDALRRFGVTVLRRRVLTGLPPALDRRRIVFPEAQDKAS